MNNAWLVKLPYAYKRELFSISVSKELSLAKGLAQAEMASYEKTNALGDRHVLVQDECYRSREFLLS